MDTNTLVVLVGIILGVSNLGLHFFLGGIRLRESMEVFIQRELNKQADDRKGEADDLKSKLAASRTALVELKGTLNDIKEELDQRIAGLVTSERLAQTDEVLDRVIGGLGLVFEALGEDLGQAGHRVRQAGIEFARKTGTS